MPLKFDTKELQKVIKEKFDKLKDLDYRELIKLGIEPRELHFFTKPAKFDKFFEGKNFFNLVYDIICYFRILIHVEKKQKDLEKEAKEKGLPPPKILRCDSQHTNELAKKVSNRYTLIILEWTSEKSKKAFIDSSILKKENDFFEILLLMCSKVLLPFFEDEDHPFVEEEIHRLIRTNAFNESKRKNFENEKQKRYPELKEGESKENIDETVDRLLKRSLLPKVNWKFQYQNVKSDIKPNFIKMHSFEAVHSRSPLFALVAPSVKFKLRDLEKDRKAYADSQVEKKGVDSYKKHIPTMVEKEIRNKRIKDDASDIRVKSVIKAVNRSFY